MVTAYGIGVISAFYITAQKATIHQVTTMLATSKRSYLKVTTTW